MFYELKIFDIHNNIVSLSDILNNFKGEHLHWSLLYLWATGDLGEGKSIIDLEETIANSPKGLSLSFIELKKLSNCFYQVIDTIIIGCTKIDDIRRYDTDEEMYYKCEIVIEMVDSSYWLIYSKNKEQIKQFARKFKNSEIRTSY